METTNNNNQRQGAPVDAETADVARNSGQEDNMDNPIDSGEAQNVTDGAERLSGKEAEDATRKANEGLRQGRGS